jgi:energy-coupling factor transporter transmembrane protein EcfT
MSNEYWSYILVIVGLLGFVVVGRKIWWGWYINLVSQVLWFTYAIVTQQWGFLIGAIAYTIIFSINAYKWTRDRFAPLWACESNYAKLSNIQAYTEEEASRKFHNMFHHDPTAIYKIPTYDTGDKNPAEPVRHAARK